MKNRRRGKKVLVSELSGGWEVLRTPEYLSKGTFLPTLSQLPPVILHLRLPLSISLSFPPVLSLPPSLPRSFVKSSSPRLAGHRGTPDWLPPIASILSPLIGRSTRRCDVTIISFRVPNYTPLLLPQSFPFIGLNHEVRPLNSVWRAPL